MSVLKAAVKRLFLFVNNSFHFYHHELCQCAGIMPSDLYQP